MSIGELLANTLSPEQRIREEATRRLEDASVQDFGTYLRMLCNELANESSASHVRTAAGIALKNTFVARDQHRKEEYAARWLQLQPDARNIIKSIVCQTLHSADVKTGSTAAQVIAGIAAIELPRDEWPDLISHLLENMKSESSTLKQTTLMAIGFTCEAIDSGVLEAQSDSILTAIVQGARKEESNNNVRLAAMNALYNSLEFIEKNFDREGERNFIMQVVCEATQCELVDVQVTSFECLVKVMSLYYDNMALYMQKALFGLTILGMKHENERVALQAIEFWSTVCDCELDLDFEAEELSVVGQQPDRFSHKFALQAVNDIIPVLLWLLTKKEDEEDEDEWTVSMAAGICLALFANTAKDNVVGPVIPFVEQHIKSQDWRFREAAVMAFGSILEGPSIKILGPLTLQALPVLIEMMKDPVSSVKDTTAWTLGRVSNELHMAIDPQVHLGPLIAAVCGGLVESGRVASTCAWCLMNLAEKLDQEDPDAPSKKISPYFEPITQALIGASGRSDVDPHVRASIYEALNSLIQYSAKDTHSSIEAVLRVCLERLNQALQMQNDALSVEEKIQIHETQANLCSVLAAIIRRLGRSIAPVADSIMAALLATMQHASKTSTVMEDAFLTAGALCTVLESDFIRYLDPFLPFLYGAIQRHEEYQACSIAIGLVGDLCRSLNDKILPSVTDIMTLLGQALANPLLHRSVRPSILVCFGDVALAIGPHFEHFLPDVMNALMAAVNTEFPLDSAEAYDYLSQLRESVIEALVGITQGFKQTEQALIFLPYTGAIFQFLGMVHADVEGKEDGVTRAAIGLLGDLAETFPEGQIALGFKEPWVDVMLKEAKTDRNSAPATREVAKWARELVRRQVQLAG